MTEADTVHVLKEMIHMSGTMKNWKAKKQIPRIVSIGVLLLCAAGSVAAQEQPAATEARLRRHLGIIARNARPSLV